MTRSVKRKGRRSRRKGPYPLANPLYEGFRHDDPARPPLTDSERDRWKNRMFAFHYGWRIHLTPYYERAGFWLKKQNPNYPLQWWMRDRFVGS